MSELIVVAFTDEAKAEEVRKILFTMEKQYLLELEDAVVVVKNQEGKISINQTYNLVASGAMGGVVYGGLWGLLIGVLFLNPLLGWAAGGLVGATTGGVSGWLTDIGIDDNFIKELGNTLRPGNSALFILIKKVTPDKVINELKRNGVEGTILQTSLSTDDEAKLQTFLRSKLHHEGI
ncbi:MAG TPA: DUF1269 domain-containing protein [Parachlamydiaceae bacterium]|nr:DUF1269 domain-containing protein [Parachlamydiaceae bacterium]